MTYTKSGGVEKVSVEQHHQAEVSDSTGLQQLLWAGHTAHYFEVEQRHNSRTTPIRYDDALECLRRGARFFGVVPRVAPGNKKEHCVSKFDSLWVDIDRFEGVDSHALLDECKQILPESFQPSAVVFTGNKGLHLYWKIDRLLPIEQIEGRNKALAEVLGADRNCYDATRILAHPGSTHRKTGRLVEIIEFSAHVHPVERLELLPAPKAELPSRSAKSRIRPVSVKGEAWFKAADKLTCWGEPPELDLVNWLLSIDLAYLSSYKPQGWRRRADSRSEVEMRIVHVLVGKGASDRQIVDLAEGCFSKHVEEPSYRYLEITIRSAREHWFGSGWLTHPLGGLRKHRGAKYRRGTLDDLEEYLCLIRGQLLKEWVVEVQNTGKSRASAYRYKAGLEEVGLIEVKDRRIFRR